MARPKKEINWVIVEEEIEAGLTASQIAHGKMDIGTFYDRFKEEFGCSFSNYSQKGYECGNGKLKYTQYKKAIQGKTKELEKLCDIRLGQGKEPEKVSPLEDTNTLLHELMIARAENVKLKEKINANQSETRQELCGSDTQI